MSLGMCFINLYLIKIDAFTGYSVKIRVIFGIRFERRKVDKKANLHEDWNMQTLFWSLLNKRLSHAYMHCIFRTDGPAEPHADIQPL